MGLAQGAAARTAIRAELERADLRVKRSRMPSLRSLASGPLRGSGAGREFYRHFAHQAERLEGLAAAADVPVDSILNLHLRVRAGGSMGGLLSRRASVHARTVGHDGAKKRALLERTLPQPSSREASWILRESRPAVGFRSVEVSLPWLVSAVAGVNVGGLAIVAGPLLWGAPGCEGGSPSLLLVQECLQRFGDVSGALDWCVKRPVEGEQSFVLADASGMTATVVVNGRERRIQEGEGELYLEGGESSGDIRSDGAATGDAEGESQVVTPQLAATAQASNDHPDRVWLDPDARRLQIDAAGISIDLGLLD
jgi:hypothetical protein